MAHQQQPPLLLLSPTTQTSPLRPPGHPLHSNVDGQHQQQQQMQQAASVYGASPQQLKASPAFAGVSSGASKPKKNRKSPGLGDFDGSVSCEDVQSPAYSDMSDDSTPVADQELLDKSQPNKHMDLFTNNSKKPSDVGVGVGVSVGVGVGVPTSLGGVPTSGVAPPPLPHGMYQFYLTQQQQYMVQQQQLQPRQHQQPQVLQLQPRQHQLQPQQQQQPRQHQLQPRQQQQPGQQQQPQVLQLQPRQHSN